MSKHWLGSSRAVGVLLICMALMFFGVGCAAFKTAGDFLFGVSEDPETGEPTQDPGGGPAAMLAGLFGLGNVAQGVGSLWLNGRRKKWVKVGSSVISGLNNAYRERKRIKDADGVERWYILADTVFGKQAEAQNAHGVRRDAEKLREVVEKEEGDPDNEPEPASASTAV